MSDRSEWPPEGKLGDHVSTEVAQNLIRLARSGEQADTDQLMKIGMTQGLRHARFALDAIAAEREMFNARAVRRLEAILLIVAVVTAVAAVVQAYSELSG